MQWLSPDTSFGRKENLHASELNLLPDWSTVICAASGPSFTENQAELIKEARTQNLARVIVVNDNYLRVPNADLLYAYDGTWWDKHYLNVRKVFNGQLLTSDSVASAFFNIPYIEADPKSLGLSRHSMVIRSGGNSGYAVVNYAYLMRARRILLVGYDMQRTGGQTHWFGEHVEGLWNYHPDNMIAAWAKRFGPLATDLEKENVQVVNCTRETALRCFPRSTLERELYGY